MSDTNKDIYPVFDWILLKSNKEELLKQHAQVIWMTGLSGAGKSTIAAGLEKALYKRGYLTQIIDGDNIRTGLNRNLGFSGEDRNENLRRIAEVTKLFLNCGVITINSFITPTKEARQLVKKIVGEDSFIEVFINAPIEVCENRDVKGLYKKARKGLIKNFTGIDSPFEPPENPDVEIRTDQLNIDEAIDKLLTFIIPKIEYKE
ncbi:MAG: adenylyl-sulfate kinase [Bacteroidetes bacterium]|jgi:adenylylsulfate kinase|nr:adenylyl-sulfate kinase [Bacteroidota bacterium]